MAISARLVVRRLLTKLRADLTAYRVKQWHDNVGLSLKPPGIEHDRGDII